MHGHRASSARRGALTARAATGRGCEVTDYVLLARTRADVPEDQVYEGYSELISLMYMVTGIVVGFTGPIRQCTVRDAQGHALELDAPYTHAVHFRLSNTAAAAAFLQHPLKVEKYNAVLPGLVYSYTEAVIAGSVERDMDAVFRRSGPWEQGAEHLCLAAANAACSEGHSARDVAEYLALLSQAAESSVAGSMQSVSGVLCGAPAGDAADPLQAAWADGPPTHAVMSRFQSVGEAAAFARLPPVQALGGADARSPAVAIVDLVFEIEAVQDSSKSSTGMANF